MTIPQKPQNPKWLRIFFTVSVTALVAICLISLFFYGLGGNDEPRPPADATPPATTKAAAPEPTGEPAPTEPNVRPGAFCSPEGAAGLTVEGIPMTCSREPGEEQARWRAAD